MFTLNQVIALSLLAFAGGLVVGVCFAVYSLWQNDYIHLVPAPKA